MKTKLFTTNVDVAAVAAFGGLIVTLMFPLFSVAYGYHLSIIALAITLWGFLSLRQMDTPRKTQRAEATPPVFHTPKHYKNKRSLIIAAVIVLMSGGILFGTIKMIGATQTDTPPWTKEGQQWPCPHPQSKSHCTLLGDSGQRAQP